MQQSKLNFKRTQNYCANYDSYTFKQNEILMGKPTNSLWICHIGVEKIVNVLYMLR